MRFKNKWGPHPNRRFYFTLLIPRAAPISHVPRKIQSCLPDCFFPKSFSSLVEVVEREGEREREVERENECFGEAGAEIRRVGDASTAVLRQLHGQFVQWEVASICWSAASSILQCLHSASSGLDLSLFFLFSLLFGCQERLWKMKGDFVLSVLSFFPNEELSQTSYRYWTEVRQGEMFYFLSLFLFFIFLLPQTMENLKFKSLIWSISCMFLATKL